MLLAFSMVAVMLLDITRYIIPNLLNLGILVLYIAAAYMLGLPFGWALLAAGVTLLFGLGLFALGLMGGGDIKLLVVLMLWTGWSIVSLQFVMMTAVFGGVLVVVVLLMRATLPPLFSAGKLPRILTRKEPVPYGVAIAGAFLFLLSQGMIAGVPSPF